MNLNDNESAEVAVLENIQRKDLSAIEEAKSYKKLLDRGYLTQEQLASRMGKTQATISNKLRLLGLSEEVKGALLNQKISERHARSLLSLKSEDEQKDVLNRIITNRLTVRQTDELVKSLLDNQTEILDVGQETPDVSIEPNNITPISDIRVDIPMFNSSSTFVGTNPQPDKTFVSDKQSENDNEEIQNQPIQSQFGEPIEAVTIPPIEAIMTFGNDGIDNFSPISNINVNQIKEEAEDINPARELVDVNALLKTDQESNEEEKAQSEEEVRNRFISDIDNDLEDYSIDNKEIASFNPQTVSNFQPESTSQVNSFVSIPKTYTDSLVEEYRQNNNQQNDKDKVVKGNLKSAIDSIRKATKTLSENDFNVDMEEFDFEKIYQVIIRINK